MSPAKPRPLLIKGALPKLEVVAADPRYAAGQCNIGPAEINRRRRAGHVGTIVSVALLAVLIVVQAAPIARFVIALTATGAASGYLQARLRFCAAYGSRGVYGFDEAGRTTAVADKAARARDRLRSMQIGVAAGAIGLAVGIAAVLLPV
jgi:hypothetical protein